MFVCKSISLANFLISNGSKIVRVDKDKESNRYIVFLFKKDKLFYDNMKEWNTK